MPDEPWVHVYVCTPETAFQVLDPTKARPKPAPRVSSIRTAYAIALKILIILSRLL